jgi:DNA-binding NarL/FixJ family response regulator
LKRKTDIVELSDSEDERVTKRRQFDPSPTPVPSTASSTSTKNAVKPWDQVHAGKKLPTSSKPDVTAKLKSKNPPLEIVELSTQQKAILEVVKDGKNVFFTGSAGSLFRPN